MDLRWEGPNIVEARFTKGDREITYVDRPNSREVKIEPTQQAGPFLVVRLVGAGGAWTAIGLHYVQPVRKSSQSLLLHVESDAVTAIEIDGKRQLADAETLPDLEAIRSEILRKCDALLEGSRVAERVQEFRAEYEPGEIPSPAVNRIKAWREIVRLA